MTDPAEDRSERPIADGLIALAVVALAVGVILGIAAFAGAKIVGLGGDDGGGSNADAAADTLSIPPIVETTGNSGPQIQLNTPGDAESSASSSEASTEATEEESEAAEGEISLSAGQVEVDNFGRIDLTGTYPGGEGAVLQVQRLESGVWRDFPATTAVSGETFSTYVQTGINGVNTFRVLDKSAKVSSNEVRVTVGS